MRLGQWDMHSKAPQSACLTRYGVARQPETRQSVESLKNTGETRENAS